MPADLPSAFDAVALEHRHAGGIEKRTRDLAPKWEPVRQLTVVGLRPAALAHEYQQSRPQKDDDSTCDVARPRRGRDHSSLVTKGEAGRHQFAADGSVEVGFETVREAFGEVLAAQRGTGAALAAWHEGRWVVDLWGGAADAAGRVPWRRDSIVQPYSVGKPFVAMCALLLVDRGLLDLDAPVQRYWPEFTAQATVRHVLSHQAGVVALDAPAPTEVFYDWDALCSLLAVQQPVWAPGTAHGESALFYGHLLGRSCGVSTGAALGPSFARNCASRRTSTSSSA